MSCDTFVMSSVFRCSDFRRTATASSTPSRIEFKSSAWDFRAPVMYFSFSSGIFFDRSPARMACASSKHCFCIHQDQRTKAIVRSRTRTNTHV